MIQYFFLFQKICKKAAKIVKIYVVIIDLRASVMQLRALRTVSMHLRDYALLAIQTVTKSTVKLFIFLNPFVVCRPTPL